VMIPAPMPGPDVFDLRNPAKARSQKRASVRPELAEGRTSPVDPLLGGMAVAAGSNAWAIASSHTADGRALVSSDPHLPLRVPNVWYRVSLEWRDEQAAAHRLTGAVLPGLPFVGLGSNGHVAWGFTVAFDDRSDMVIVEPVADHPDMYRTPEGPKAFGHTLERIRVKGVADVPLEITSTIWGPLVGRDDQGHPIAHQWQAHHPEGINLTFAQIEEAETVEAAIDLANRSGMPSYNLIVADDRGSIGWTVTGRLPRRVGFDGRVPTSRTDGTRRWDGWLEPAEYPRVVNPGSGRVWTSNNRQIPRPLLDRLGLEGYVTGPRARQVRDDLMARDRMTPRDLLGIQLDDRALFLERWRRFLLDELRDDTTRNRPERREFQQLVQASWNGHAAASSVGYLLVQRFRHELAQLAIGPLVPAPVQRAFRPEEFVQWWESALWRLVHERPRHLLSPRWNDWTDVTLAAVDATIAVVRANGRPLSEATWGSTTARMAHPLAAAVPWLAPWLDMPFTPMPGDANMPRLRQPSELGDVSATLRMVVSPGHEETGIFYMPGGQSGHPLSPHYRDMHERWVEDHATPFLPGPTVQTLTLLPEQRR
jgi:penicillin G amidase